jgi:hypothetical protein
VLAQRGGPVIFVASRYRPIVLARLERSHDRFRRHSVSHCDDCYGDMGVLRRRRPDASRATIGATGALARAPAEFARKAQPPGPGSLPPALLLLPRSDSASAFAGSPSPGKHGKGGVSPWRSSSLLRFVPSSSDADVRTGGCSASASDSAGALTSPRDRAASKHMGISRDRGEGGPLGGFVRRPDGRPRREAHLWRCASPLRRPSAP